MSITESIYRSRARQLFTLWLQGKPEEAKKALFFHTARETERIAIISEAIHLSGRTHNFSKWIESWDTTDSIPIDVPFLVRTHADTADRVEAKFTDRESFDVALAQVEAEPPPIEEFKADKKTYVDATGITRDCRRHTRVGETFKVGDRVTVDGRVFGTILRFTTVDGLVSVRTEDDGQATLLSRHRVAHLTKAHDSLEFGDGSKVKR